MLIKVTRTHKSADGIFGTLQIDADPFKCVTLENLAQAIPVGIYDVFFMWSDHFHQIMPHIIVPAIPSANLPKRIAIEVHWANYPVQLEGCIALGTEEDFKDDMVILSKNAWIEFAKTLTDQPSIKLKVIEDFA